MAQAGLRGGTADDGDRVGQVEQLHLRRSPAEDLLAQQGVEVHAVESPLLVALDGRLAGLVVGDHELAVGVELEAVDDAPQRDPADRGLQPQLEADRVDTGGVLQLEVAAQQGLGLGEEVPPRPSGDRLRPVNSGSSRMRRDAVARASTAAAGVRSGRGQREQALEGGVHQRARGWTTATAAPGAGRWPRSGTRARSRGRRPPCSATARGAVPEPRHDRKQGV